MNSVVGIYIEPRRLHNVLNNISNFFNVLPDSDLYFFCGKGDKKFFLGAVKNPRLTIIELEVNNLTAQTYSDLLKSEVFWERFLAYTHAITIQSDGCLCKESGYLLTDFLHYDYVGGYAKQGWWLNQGFFDEQTSAKINAAFQCFNGGFSLRSINSTLQVIRTFRPRMTKAWANSPEFHIHYPEDLYFVIGMVSLNKNVGNDHMATKFCSHGGYVANTFCIHNLARFVDAKELEEAILYCPEYKNFIRPEMIYG